MMSTAKETKKEALTGVPVNRVETIVAQFIRSGATDVQVKLEPSGSRKFTIRAVFPDR